MDLVFSRPRYIQGEPLDLVFGGEGGGVGPALPLTVQGTIYFGGTAVSGVALYDNRLPSYVSASLSASHQSAQPAGTQRVTTWDQPVVADRMSDSDWQSADRTDAAPRTPWGLTDRADAQGETPWQHAAPVSQRRSTIFQACTPVEFLRAIGWQHATDQSVNLLAGHQVADPMQVLRTMRVQVGQRMAVDLLAPHQVGTPAQRAIRARWQVAAQLIPPGLTVYVPPGGGDGTLRPVSLDLVFACPPYEQGAPLDLIFGHACVPEAPGAAVIVPTRRTYIVINTATLHRVSDNAVVPCFNLTLSLDRDSWSWGFGASVPASAAGMLLDEPDVELRTVVNGTEFRLVVEDAERDRAFGQMGLRVSGNGRNTFLDETPMLFGNTVARTAQQLMLDVLTENGVSIGWNVDWQLTDWLVPAGVFNHSGTYRSALATIAAAAGGFIRPHPSLQTLSVLHRYPVAPWDWATAVPAIELPAAVATREGTRWVNKPEYNRVFVMGEGAGINGRVTRAGTAGDKPAQMVVDPLITATAAARQRGIAILGDTGRQRMLSLRLPVLPETGIILPGTLLRYLDQDAPRMGVVHGVNVDVQMPAIYQTLEVESHE